LSWAHKKTADVTHDRLSLKETEYLTS